jgi:hypothetical protein
MAAAFIVVFDSQVATSNRLSDSIDSQLTSAYYVRDVQGAAYATTDSATSVPAQCGSGSSFLLGLYWPDTIADTVVSYWSVPTSGSATTTQIIRRACTNGSTSPSNTIVAVGAGASQLPASITCAAACSPLTGWVPTVGISNITLGASEPGSGYTFSLVSSPRGFVEATGGSPPEPPPLLLLGPSSATCPLSQPVLDIENHSSVTVESSGNPTGTLSVDSACNGAVGGAYAVHLTNNTGLYAGQLLTEANPPGNTVSVANSATSTATPTYQAGGIPDPYRVGGPKELDPPPTGQPTGSCSVSANNYDCTPGEYKFLLNISTNGAHVTFQPGVYVFDNGVQFANNVVVTNSTDSNGGVFFYIGGTGTIALSSNVTVTLSSMTTGPYAGVQVFQSRTDPAPFQLNNLVKQFSLGGVLYLPDAPLQVQNNTNITISSVIAQSVSCVNYCSVLLGS